MKKSWPWSSGPKAPKPNHSEINHFAYGAWIGLSLGLCSGMLQWSGPVYFLLALFSAGVMGRVFRELAIDSRAPESPRLDTGHGVLSSEETDPEDDRSMEVDEVVEHGDASELHEGLAKVVLKDLLIVALLFVILLWVSLKFP